MYLWQHSISQNSEHLDIFFKDPSLTSARYFLQVKVKLSLDNCMDLILINTTVLVKTRFKSSNLFNRGDTKFLKYY